MNRLEHCSHWEHNTIQHNTTQYNTTQYNTRHTQRLKKWIKGIKATKRHPTKTSKANHRQEHESNIVGYTNTTVTQQHEMEVFSRQPHSDIATEPLLLSGSIQTHRRKLRRTQKQLRFHRRTGAGGCCCFTTFPCYLCELLPLSLNFCGSGQTNFFNAAFCFPAKKINPKNGFI